MGNNNSPENGNRILTLIILAVCGIAALGIIGWLFKTLLKIAIIVVVALIVVYVLYLIFGSSSSPAKKQNYYLDENGHKVYTKSAAIEGKDVIVESKIVKCKGCGISLSSGIDVCPKCGTKNS